MFEHKPCCKYLCIVGYDFQPISVVIISECLAIVPRFDFIHARSTVRIEDVQIVALLIQLVVGECASFFIHHIAP